MPVIPPYVKTPKGIEEVNQRCHGLGQKERRLLILIDGKRDLSSLGAMLPGHDVETLFLALADGGFIVPLKPAPEEPARASQPARSAVPAPEDDAQRYDMARNFMLNTLNAFVGIGCSSLIQRIEAAADLDRLRPFFGEWRDAIGLSGDGRKVLPDLEGRLAALLS